MIRIGIAEDQALVRESLAIVLDLQPDVKVCWTAASGTDAVRLAETDPVDVILMDLRLPGLDGVSATKQIKFGAPEVCILILTTFHQEEWLHEALAARAAACFLKEVPPQLLMDAIRKIITGEWNPADWTPDWRKYAPEIQFSSKTVSDSKIGADEYLTGRELEILRAICKGATNAEIALQLHLSEGTVKNYVSTLYAKLQIRHRAEAVQIAHKRGLC